MAAHLSPEWTGSGAGTLPSPWVRACPPACCVGVRVCTRTTACTRTHCGLTTASAGSASPPKTAAKNTQQSSNHWPVTPVVFPPPNAACQLTTTVEDAPRKTDWRGETDPDLLSTVKTILGERGCGRHSGKSREQTFGDSADPSARLTPGPMNEGLCSGIQDASPPWVHVGTAASPGQGPELPAAGGPPPGPSALSPPPNTAGKTDHTDARVPALLAAGPCPAHVQADNGTAGLGPEGSCPDAPQLQVACKTRQVQGVAQPHTAREVGKSHGPTTLPAIVEGRALPSGTQPTRPTQVPARRLGPHPGCDQTAAGPWGHTWGGGNHRGQPVKGTLKGLRQTGRHTNKLSLVQTKERVGKSSK